MPVLFILSSIDLVWKEGTRLNNNFLLFQRSLRNVIGVVIYHKLLSIIKTMIEIILTLLVNTIPDNEMKLDGQPPLYSQKYSVR